MSKTAYLASIIVTIFLGITLGIIVHVYHDEKIEKATLKQVEIINSIKKAEEEQNKVIHASAEEEKVSPNANIIFETYYSSCGHSEIKTNKVDKNDVNKTKAEIKEKYPDWEIKIFTKDEIRLYKEQESRCNNHFIIKENNGYVSVYTLDEEGNELLKEKTDISTKYLPNEDIELLKKGIKANNENQLEQILSDYE